ncbi:MAG: hypothetical protein ACP5N3_03135 [Candidatus Nanoarchaeia archaeon]
MNFKPTATKSIVASIVPLVLAMIAFKYKYCTDCPLDELVAQQRQTAMIVLLASFIVIYLVWSFVEKQPQPKRDVDI